MFILFYITAGFLFVYWILIQYYHKAWKEIPLYSAPGFSGTKERIKISIIIPARNEEDNIGLCLSSLSRQTYPAALTEIIVINDHSTDRTEELVRNFPMPNIRLLQLSDLLKGDVINSYKKKAIEMAVKASTGQLIITTDADCTASPDWIETMAACYHQHQLAFIAAPVKIVTNNSLLSIFQAIDFLTLQGITGASVYKGFHSMCNGANLGYEKKAFVEVDGFNQIDKIASGDDMMLMHKIVSRFPGRSYFLKSPKAIVNTRPADTWRGFINQRIRWASKAGSYDDKRITAVLLLVYLLNAFLLIFLVAGFWNVIYLGLFVLLAVSKTIIEYPFVRSISTFFRQQRLMAYFPLLQPLHILYTVVAGWLGIFGTYEWKSRKVK